MVSPQLSEEGILYPFHKSRKKMRLREPLRVQGAKPRCDLLYTYVSKGVARGLKLIGDCEIVIKITTWRDHLAQVDPPSTGPCLEDLTSNIGRQVILAFIAYFSVTGSTNRVL